MAASPVSETSIRWRAYLVGIAVIFAVAGTLVLWFRPGMKTDTTVPEPFPLLCISSSPFLNTQADTTSVGSERCYSCHKTNTSSFRQTGMGRSMASVDLRREPADGSYDHAPSKRRYQVVRKNGEMWHRELLLGTGSEEVVLSEFPVKYVVGSGRHSLTYLVEADGFLVESPITWYRSKNSWAMSPGYDNAAHVGFERAIGEGCLDCHAGQAKAVDNSLHRMKIHEAAIGCERCHGPGSLHVEHQNRRKKNKELAPEEIDYTIVKPTRLSRDLAEAICQQCHLRTNATIIGRGRKATDFRPGLPLQDFRQDYMLDVPGSSMTVVGHVEQMHLSKCYQNTSTLTCTTCHSPHHEPTPDKRETYYTRICSSCHKSEHCKVDLQIRKQKSPTNNCVHCHMPTSPTEIPHLAFTHHRIGLHDLKLGRRTATGNPGQLNPFLDLSRLSEMDRVRSLGLGYLETANREGNASHQRRYQTEAMKLLTRVQTAGMPDPAVSASLARLSFDMGHDGVAWYAEKALKFPGLAAQDRCNALFLLADSRAREGKFADAIKACRELTQLRRHPIDWLLLAKCLDAVGDSSSSIEALQQATRINPRLWKVHETLAGHYRRKGNLTQATWHEKRVTRNR